MNQKPQRTKGTTRPIPVPTPTPTSPAIPQIRPRAFIRRSPPIFKIRLNRHPLTPNLPSLILLLQPSSFLALQIPPPIISVLTHRVPHLPLHNLMSHSTTQISSLPLPLSTFPWLMSFKKERSEALQTQPAALVCVHLHLFNVHLA